MLKTFFKNKKSLLFFFLGIFFLRWQISWAIWDVTKLYVFGLSYQSIYWILYNFMFWILSLVGIFGVIGFAISGILYFISTGDDTQMTKAKKAMQYSLIGIIVALSGLVILQAVYWALAGFAYF